MGKCYRWTLKKAQLVEPNRAIKTNFLVPKQCRQFLPTNTGLINSKCLHSSLHSVEACTLPHKINTKTMDYINWDSLYTEKQNNP